MGKEFYASKVVAPTSAVITCYATLRRATDVQMYKGAAGFEPLNYTNWSAYVLSVGSSDSLGDWSGDFPVALVTPGLYYYDVWQRVGGSPTPPNVAGQDVFIGNGVVRWNGSAGIDAVVDLDLAQPIPATSQVIQTVGDALNAARAGGFGKRTYTPIDSTSGSENLYAADGSTVIRTFSVTIDGAGNITQVG